MSGGHFDYQQYNIGYIADSIIREIARAKQPLPPITKRKGISSKIKTGERSYTYDGRYYNFFRDINHARQYFATLDDAEILSDEILSDGEAQLTILDKRHNETRIFTTYTEEVYLDENGEQIYVPDYSESTIREFKTAILALRIAYIYAQRIDYLASGDDGEETFHERLAEELSQVNEASIDKEIQEAINELTNNHGKLN